MIRHSRSRQPYRIQQLDGPFGFRRDGFGRVLFLFIGEVDLLACDLVVNAAYGNGFDGHRFCAEYDPSVIDVGDFSIEDEISLKEVLVTNALGLKTFIEKLAARQVALVFVDSEERIITQQLDAIDLASRVQDIRLFAREYDYPGDY